MDKQQLASTVNKVLDEMRQRPIPYRYLQSPYPFSGGGLCRALSRSAHPAEKALLQPGQYAAEQTVTLVGPKDD